MSTINKLQQKLNNQKATMDETKAQLERYKAAGADASIIAQVEAQLRRQTAATAVTAATLELEQKLAKAKK